MEYKGLLVDLDDTMTMSYQLYNKALKYVAKFLAKEYTLDVDKLYTLAQEKYLVISRDFPTVHTRHSRILLFRRTLDEMVGTYDLAILPKVEDMYWSYFLKNLKLFPEVKETLKELHSTGVKIAIVSDGDLSLRIRKAATVGLLQLVDEVVASEEVIFEKPFSAIFTLALSRLEVEPHEVVMLGNNYKNDISGAQLLDIRAGVFIPEEGGHPEGQDGTVKPDFIIHKFSELLGVMGDVN